MWFELVRIDSVFTNEPERKATPMTPTGIDQIEIKAGTYRAHLDVPAADVAAKLVKDHQYQATTTNGRRDRDAHVPFIGAKPNETVGDVWSVRAARVIRGWKNSRLFKGATFATRDAVTKAWKPTTLASLCAMFDVEAPKGAAPVTATEAPAAPVETAPVAEAPAPTPVVETPAAPAADVVQRLTLFTLGFDGGLPLDRVVEIVKDRAIDLVVDIRSKANTSTEFEIRKLRALWGDRYTTKAQLKGGIAAILPRLQDQGSARVLLLRKEEAPGDHWGTLEIARLAIAAKIPCLHLFQNEEVTAEELQRAIDLDIQQGGDHYYACDVEIDDMADARAKARKRIEKLDRLAKGNPNANEGKSAAAEASRLRAQFGIREAA
jgi:hypothetical protein